VKLGQFRALCDREWMQEARGDVQALSLTDDSYEELRADALVNYDPVLVPMTLGPLELMNPVTRSAVKVTGGAASDTTEVCSVSGFRTIALT
jgi:hypothetical protein